MKKIFEKKKVKIALASILGLIALLAVIINLPEKLQAANHEDTKITATDSVPNNPKIDIKVRKKYDDNGNLIGYDSTYSYVYVSPGGKAEEINMDSLMQQFQPFFFQHGQQMFKDPFEEFFKNDPFLNDNFFDEHFFENQFNQNMFNFKEMFQRMDSLRNEFLKQQYPNFTPGQTPNGLKVPKKKQNDKNKKTEEEFY